MEFLKFLWSQLQQLRGARYWAMYTPSVYFGIVWKRFFKALRNGCAGCLPWIHTDLFQPFGAGSAHWVPLHAWNQVLGPGHCSRAPERAPRPSRHLYGSGCAYLSPRYAWRAVACGYCLLWRLTACDYLWETYPKTGSSLAGIPNKLVLPTSLYKVSNR